MSDTTIVKTVDQVAEEVKSVETVIENPDQKVITDEGNQEVKAPEVVKIDLHDAAVAIAAKLENLVVRPTNSTGYRILGTKENTELNWRKGLFYVLNQYSKGFNLEMQAYSVKKGAHLAEFNPKFQALGGKTTSAGDSITCEKFGLASRLRIRLPFSVGLDEMVKKAESFIKEVEPTVNEVRALLKDEDFIKAPKKVVSKKETPVQATTNEKIPVTPALVETPVETPVEAPKKTVSKGSKKSSNRK